MKLDWFEWESYIYLALATVWNGTWEPMGREAKLLVLIDKMLGTQWKFDTASKLDSSQLAGPTRKRHKKWMVCMWPPRWCSVPLLLTGGFQFNLQFPNLSRLCICTYISWLVYISLLFLLYWGAFSSRQDFFFPSLLFVVTTNSRSPELVFFAFHCLDCGFWHVSKWNRDWQVPCRPLLFSSCLDREAYMSDIINKWLPSGNFVHVFIYLKTFMTSQLICCESKAMAWQLIFLFISLSISWNTHLELLEFISSHHSITDIEQKK